jgi:hypothetical protein
MTPWLGISLVGQRGAGDQAIDVFGRKTRAAQAADGFSRDLRVGVGRRPGLRVDGVVALRMPLLRSTMRRAREGLPAIMPSTFSISSLPTGALGRKADVPLIYTLPSGYIFVQVESCEPDGCSSSVLRRSRRGLSHGENAHCINRLIGTTVTISVIR